MDEQSHKEEMRSALRGDFERLQARGGATGTTVQHGGARAEAIKRETRAKGERPLLARLFRRG